MRGRAVGNTRAVCRKSDIHRRSSMSSEGLVTASRGRSGGGGQTGEAFARRSGRLAIAEADAG